MGGKTNLYDLGGLNLKQKSTTLKLDRYNIFISKSSIKACNYNNRSVSANPELSPEEVRRKTKSVTEKEN